VWDVAAGVRVTPGEQPAEQRLFVRIADRAVFVCGLNPRAPCYPTTEGTMHWALRLALEASSLQRRGEPDAEYQARHAAELAAWRAAQRAELARGWAELHARCAGPCPTCDGPAIVTQPPLAAPRPTGNVCPGSGPLT
jgi:hypothetical protein